VYVTEGRRKQADGRARANKVRLNIRLDADIVDYFRVGGGGYQTRINDALRAVMEADGGVSQQRVANVGILFQIDELKQ
jgi:uncharacterized protein (DUF4415 family)